MALTGQPWACAVPSHGGMFMPLPHFLKIFPVGLDTHETMPHT